MLRFYKLVFCGKSRNNLRVGCVKKC